MILQNSPFRDFDSLFNQRFGRTPWVTSSVMPMDAYRRGDDVWVHLDLPGVVADTIDISVERNVLTVAAERHFQREEGDRLYFDERTEGAYRRQVSLGEGLDAEGIEADYTDGVLTLRIPVAPQAKPRKITVGNLGTSPQPSLETTASDAG